MRVFFGNIILAGIFFCCPVKYFSQNKKTGVSAGTLSKEDSLKKIISFSKSDTALAGAYVELAGILYVSNPDTILPMCKKSLSIIERAWDKADTQSRICFLKAKSACYNNMGVAYKKEGNISMALEYYNKSLKIDELLNDKSGMAYALTNLGGIYSQQGNLGEALNHYKKSLALQQQVKDNDGIIKSFINIGSMYHTLGNIPLALEYYLKAVSLAEKTGENYGRAYALQNMAYIYQRQGDLKTTIDLLEKSLKIREEMNDKNGIAISLNNLGSVYSEKKEYERSKSYFERSLKMRTEIGDKRGIAQTISNIGKIYRKEKKYDAAIKSFLQSFEMQEAIDDNEGMAHSLFNLSDSYFKQEKYKEAIPFCDSSLRLSKRRNYVEIIDMNEELLSKIYNATGKFEQAFQHYKLYIFYRDSLQNEKNTKKTVQIQMQYEFDKKESQTKTEQEKKDLKSEEDKRKQRLILWFTVSGLLTVLILAGIILRSLILNKRKNKIISEQKKIVEMQKHIVEEKQKEILDSIYYARRIQRALITSEKYIRRKLSEMNPK